MRSRGARCVEGGRYATGYDPIMVDEAQDLAPVVLSLLAEVSKDASGLNLPRPLASRSARGA